MRNIIFAALALAFLAGCAPDDGRAEFEKGEAAYAARDLKVAVLSYKAAAEKNPTNFTARMKLALANVDLGEIDAARAAVDSALSVEPDSAEARLLQGHIAYLAKDYKLAKDAFADIVSAKQLSKELRSKALVAQAVMELTANVPYRARIALWRAIRLDRRNAAAWYHLAYLSRDTYRFKDAALEQFQVASRLMTDPGRVETVTRNIIPAIRESSRARVAGKPGAAARDPGEAAKLVTEGERLEKRDPKKAAAKFSEAYSKDPLSFAAAWNFAKSRSDSAKSDKDVARVLTAFQDAIDQRPNSQLTYRTAARFALNRGRPIRAERFLSQALAHNPEDKTTLELYVQTLRRIGKTSEARLYGAYLKEL
jgi:tetratricopeptide (TPR) repeat protein